MNAEIVIFLVFCFIGYCYIVFKSIRSSIREAKRRAINAKRYHDAKFDEGLRQLLEES
jgi:hypothetical protein